MAFIRPLAALPRAVNKAARRRRVVILGSTGSIGRSAIQVISRLKGFDIVGLAANRDIDRLEMQARSLKVEFAAVADLERARELARRMGRRVKVLAGPEGVAEAGGWRGADTVISAMVGSAGLVPTLRALRDGKRVALANKETLVVGGELIAREIARSGGELVPVDSEHSAIFQCLEGRRMESVSRIVLTGSGGPFLRRRRLSGVTVDQALRHPTWNMGKKVTIDSATLMNKGLELIEAKWLFGVPVSSIQVLIHPQSIVHSLVEFNDGAMLAQLGTPDMKAPIQYALTYPERVRGLARALDLPRTRTLSFEKPDLARFPCLRLAREAAERAGTAPVVLNAANEIAVQAFLDRRIGFNEIGRIIGRTLRAFPARKIESAEHLYEVDREARATTGRAVWGRA